MAKILIIEDSAPNRDLLLEMLKDIADCVFAETGLAGVELFNEALKKRDYYDLILLDIGLPELSGMELLQKIRKVEHCACIKRGDGIPIIMVTAYKERFVEAFDKGCHDYVLKPIDPDVLIQKVCKYIPQS